MFTTGALPPYARYLNLCAVGSRVYLESLRLKGFDPFDGGLNTGRSHLRLIGRLLGARYLGSL